MPINTKVADAIVTEKDFDWAELAHQIYGAFALAKVDTPNFRLENLNTLRQSFAQSVKIPVIDRKAVTINNARSLTITAPELDSKFVNLTFFTMSSNIVMRPADFDGDAISYSKAFAREILALQEAWRRQLDATIVAKLIANKTQVDGSAGVPYPFVANTYNVPNLDHEQFLNEVDALMTYNDFDGESLNILGDPSFKSYVNKLGQNALYQAENKAIMLGDKSLFFSKNVPKTAKMGAFAMTKGSIGLTNWNNPQSSAPRKAQQNPAGEDGIAYFPLLDFNVEVLQVLGKADLSATLGAGHETATVESFQFSTEFCLLENHISDRAVNPSNILQANIGV